MRIPNSNFLFFIINVIICLLIFFIDLHVISGVAISIPYIATIMVSLWLPGTRHTIDFAILCSILTFLGFHLSPEGGDILHAIINRSMSIFAIWITAGIAVYNKNISLKVEHSEHRKQAILSSSLEPIIILDAKQNIQSVSHSITKFFQWTPKELIGQEIYTLINEPQKTEYRQALLKAIAEKTDNIINTSTEIIGIRKDKSVFPCEISIRKVSLINSEPGSSSGSSSEETIFTIILRDIQERKKYENKLIWISSHDGLTEIFNRRYFNEHLEIEWKRLARSNSPISLIMIDIDYFKKYNDIFGHPAGDNCLRNVAKALQRSLKRPADFVSRYGGEEFAILLPNTDEEGAANIAKKIKLEIKKLNIPHSYPDLNSYMTASIGVITDFTSNDNSTKDLIHKADLALYEAKKQGRNRFVSYDRSMDEKES